MAKGSRFEREIAKQLSLWWTHGSRDDIFWRTSQSGGRATIRRRKGKSTANQDGDLCAIDPCGQPLMDKVTIELKVGYNAWTIKEIIDSPTREKATILEKFFQQCERESENQKHDSWWLITRQDRRRTLLFINHKAFKWILMQCRQTTILFVPFITICHQSFGPIHIFVLEDFLKKIEPDIYINDK